MNSPGASPAEVREDMNYEAWIDMRTTWGSTVEVYLDFANKSNHSFSRIWRYRVVCRLCRSLYFLVVCSLQPK